jgi:hypothetical protein
VESCSCDRSIKQFIYLYSCDYQKGGTLHKCTACRAVICALHLYARSICKLISFGKACRKARTNRPSSAWMGCSLREAALVYLIASVRKVSLLQGLPNTVLLWYQTTKFYTMQPWLLLCLFIWPQFQREKLHCSQVDQGSL